MEMAYNRMEMAYNQMKMAHKTEMNQLHKITRYSDMSDHEFRIGIALSLKINSRRFLCYIQLLDAIISSIYPPSVKEAWIPVASDFTDYLTLYINSQCFVNKNKVLVYLLKKLRQILNLTP